MKSLNRRTFLRGALGTAVALPTLEIMLNSNGTAWASGGSICKRFFVGFGGHALGADGDTVHNEVVPVATGPGYDLRRATATLANHGNVAADISIISGLRIPYNTGGGIPAGGWNSDFHIQALGPLISGMRNNANDDHGVNGPSSDQIVAEAIGQDTLFKSLVYQVQASWYLTASAPYGRDLISYRQEGNSIIAIPGQTSPRVAYDTLFTSFVPADDGDAAIKASELLKRQSVIDLVRADYQRLVPKLGTVDRQRMQRHLDEIRDLENLLDATGPSQGEICQLLADPGTDPAIGGDNEGSNGVDFDVNKGWSDEDGRARILADLVHMAFACDMTRSASMLYTMAQSHMNSISYTGLAYDQHEVGHAYQGTGFVSDVVAWHYDHFGYLVAKLRDTPEGAGSLLDNCALVYMNEAGHGYDPGSGDTITAHSTENMVCLTAGRAGGLVAGEHIVADGYHPGNVLNSAMKAVGVDQNLGEVVGTIPGLI
mgnify:CR=1 FL=1